MCVPGCHDRSIACAQPTPSRARARLPLHRDRRDVRGLEGIPQHLGMDSLVARKVYRSKNNRFKWKGMMYLVRWSGTDPKTGKAWPEKWEEMDHAKPGNISRSLDWDRLLSEFCKSTNTDPSVVMADRYRRNEEGDEELQSGDELQDDPDMSHSDESESEDSDGDSDESDSDREDEGQKEGHWQDESDSDDAPSDSDDSSSSDASEDGGSDSDADADIDEEMG